MIKKNFDKAFTLLESLIAIVLIGLAVAAMLVASQSFTELNAAGIEISTSEYLIEQIRERTAALSVVDPQDGVETFGPELPEEPDLASYDDLDDFNGKTFDPPLDIDMQELSDFTGYAQKITVENVDAANLTQPIAQHGSNFVRVTVEITRNGSAINSASWIRSR